MGGQTRSNPLLVTVVVSFLSVVAEEAGCSLVFFPAVTSLAIVFRYGVQGFSFVNCRLLCWLFNPGLVDVLWVMVYLGWLCE